MGRGGLRRALPGTAPYGRGQYKNVTPTVGKLTKKVWLPVAGTNLNADNTIEFDMTVGPDELVRFIDNPFHLRFKVAKKNATYVAGSPAGTAASVEYHFLRPQTELADGAYLDPALGGQSFFSRLVVLVNSVPVEGPLLGDMNFLYQAMNRAFTTPSVRRERLGEDFDRISVTDERTYTTIANIPKKLMDNMASLTFDGIDKSKWMLSQFSFDGVWPLACPQSNILRTITKTNLENGFLPPNMRLTFRLTRRDDPAAAIERPKITDTVYYGAGNAAAGDTPDFHVFMKDLFIVYESVILDKPSDLVSLTRGETRNYYVDVPKLRLERLIAGTSISQTSFPVPPGTRVVILAWLMEWQVTQDKASRKNLSARFTFPVDARNVKLTFKGKDGVVFSEGLEDFGVDLEAVPSCTSIACKTYHQEMGQKGLYPKKFESMFPRTGRSYDQIYMVDLTPYDVSLATEMVVTVDYKGTGSPDKTFMLATTLQQYRYTYHGDKLPLTQQVVL
jgi:hypothetical protein